MINPKKRFEVLKRDNFRCQYCGREGKDVTLEVDHIEPKSKWWTDELNNLITCCRECNMWKWSVDLASWDSKFEVKLKDLHDYIKSEFYKHWNLMVSIASKHDNKKYDSTLSTKTMWLISSFLKWRIDELKDPVKAKKMIEDEIECFERDIEYWWEYWEFVKTRHQSMYELYKDKSLIDLKVEEFLSWGKIFDELSWDLIWDFLYGEFYKWDDIFDDEVWNNVNTPDERLNYNLSSHVNFFIRNHWAPSWIIKRFSLFPYAKEECTE